MVQAQILQLLLEPRILLSHLLRLLHLTPIDPAVFLLYE
jgi:hypothetical protein